MHRNDLEVPRSSFLVEQQAKIVNHFDQAVAALGEIQHTQGLSELHAITFNFLQTNVIMLLGRISFRF